MHNFPGDEVLCVTGYDHYYVGWQVMNIVNSRVMNWYINYSYDFLRPHAEHAGRASDTASLICFGWGGGGG